MILLNETSHGRLIQRYRAQATGQDRKAQLGATWQIGEGQEETAKQGEPGKRGVMKAKG